MSWRTSQPLANWRWVNNVGVLIAVLGSVTLVSTREERFGLVGLMLLWGAVAWAVASWVERRSPAGARMVIALGWIVVATVMAVLSPEARVWSIFGYAGAVVYVAGYVGRGRAMATGALAWSVLLVREYTMAGGGRLGTLTMILFGLHLATVTLVVNTIGVERDVNAEALERVHDAMRTVTVQPELDPTLRSLVRAANATVAAATTGISLREGDRLVVKAIHTATGAWPRHALRKGASLAVATDGRSPLAVAVERGEPVVVLDIEREDRFPWWTEQLRPLFARYGVRSMISVPLRSGAEVVGVMESVFRTPEAANEFAVRLLEVYAEQATTVIVRAIAYEQEHLLAERLASADRLKSEFLALVSHELRTPLTAAKGFIDTTLLQWEKLDDDARRRLLERAAGNADALAVLIERLLEYSRIEFDEITLDVAGLSLAELVVDVVTQIAPALRDHDVTVSIAAGLRVAADEQAFRHVLTNLLTNATKFSPAGSRVEVTGALEEGAVVIRVRDEGPGIPPSEHERVFERFYQLPEHRGTTRGTGLGLAIVRRYAEAMGGRIGVEGDGPGTTFAWTVPAGSGDGLTAVGPRTKLDRTV